jgi:hypothetical protein
MSNHKNVFVIDPPIQYNNDEFTSNQYMGRGNSMNCNVLVIEAESNKLVNP